MSPATSILLALQLTEATAAPADTTEPAIETTASPASPTPQPPTWTRVFSAAAVHAHLDEDELRVVVVPAGEHTEATPAATALTAVLADSSRVTTVHRSAPVTLDDDSEIARRAASRGYDRALVVRTFDVEERVQAVVDVLDAEGRSRDAFMAWQDEPLEIVETTLLGVSEEMFRATMLAPRPPPPPPEPEGAVYEAARQQQRQRRLAGLGLGWSLVGVGTLVTISGVVLGTRPGLERGQRPRRLIGLGSLGLLGVVSGIAVVRSTLAAGKPRGANSMARRHGPVPALSVHPTAGLDGAGVALEGRF